MLSAVLVGKRERRGMEDIVALLGRWELAARDIRERMYRVPALRERERWHALWLLAQGWSANKVTDLRERDPHTIGRCLTAFARAVPVPSPSSRPVTTPPPSIRTSRRS